MLKRSLLTAALVAAFAAPAYANSCPRHMKAIDEALARNPSLSPQQLMEIRSLRASGEELHKAGKHDESVATLTKAEVMLGIK